MTLSLIVAWVIEAHDGRARRVGQQRLLEALSDGLDIRALTSERTLICYSCDI